MTGSFMKINVSIINFKHFEGCSLLENSVFKG